MWRRHSSLQGWVVTATPLPYSAAMPQGVLATVIKLVILSLLVGLALSLFGVSPRNVFQWLGGAVRDVYEVALSLVRWSFEYILIGAAVVVPIWLVFFLLRVLSGRR